MVRKSPEKEGEKEAEVSYRLAKCIQPIHYDLSLTLPPQTETNPKVLVGQMAVEVNVKCATTKKITLNALNITLSNARYTSSAEGKTKVEATKIVPDGQMETVDIEFDSAMGVGTGVLEFDFEAEITDNMKGMYRTKVKENRWNYVTHFEPVHARRCFPCFDEPEFKATFNVTLTVPKDMTALSNMPVKEEVVKDDGIKVCKYEKTPIMSTYLVAVVVGDFDYMEKTVEKSGVKVRVYTPPGQRDHAEYSLNLACNLLTHYTEYFGVEYPLPKCDLVAIQEFPIGGMENYGLITFVDTRLLVNPKEKSNLDMQFASLIVSHEVSHLWFGDLVTMRWWTDLWLKEGFAKFIEYLAVDHFHPEFDVWTQFNARILQGAFATDSLQNSHPVEVPVKNPAHIDEIFDSISYFKGSSVIRMMFNFIGEDSFRKGMKAYLEKFKFGNADTVDLWEALEKASSKPVVKVMNTFIKQMGFPIVCITNIEDTAEGREFTLKQKKFWLDPVLFSKTDEEIEAGPKWIIPLNFCKESKPSDVCYSTLFDGHENAVIKVVVPDVAPNEWVKLNPGSTGFYRVLYPAKILAQFKSNIGTLSPVDRLGVLGDLFATVKAGASSTVDLLSFLSAFKAEDNYSVWSCIRDITDNLRKLLLRTDLIEKYEAYCRSLFKPVGKRLTWTTQDGEKHTDALLRAVAMNRLVTYRDAEVLQEGAKLAQEFLKGESSLAPDLRTAAFRAKLQTGNNEDLEQLLEAYRKCELSEDRTRILQSLGENADPALLKKVLEFSMSADVKLSTIDYIYFSTQISKEGQDLTWEFFKKSIGLFQERMPGGMMICGIVEDVAGSFVGEKYAEDIETFFKAFPIRGTETQVKQSLEKIRINTAWFDRDFKEISKYLESYDYNDE